MFFLPIAKSHPHPHLYLQVRL